MLHTLGDGELTIVYDYSSSIHVGANLSIVDTELSIAEGDEVVGPTVEVCVRVDAVHEDLERNIPVIFTTMDGTATTGT